MSNPHPAIAKAQVDAVAAYKKQRADVMALPEAKGREALAESLLEAGLPTEKIKASLASAPAPAGAESGWTPERYEASRAQAQAANREAASADRRSRIVKRAIGHYRALGGGGEPGRPTRLAN